MFNLKLNGLSVLGTAYVVMLAACLVGYVFPNRRTAALVRAAFTLLVVVLVLVIIWYGSLMTFYYFNGGVVSE